MMCIFHKWSKWSQPIVTYNSNKQQWRVCTECNKAMFRTLRWDKQADISKVNQVIDGIPKGEK